MRRHLALVWLSGLTAAVGACGGSPTASAPPPPKPVAIPAPTAPSAGTPSRCESGLATTATSRSAPSAASRRAVASGSIVAALKTHMRADEHSPARGAALRAYNDQRIADASSGS